MSDSRQDQAEEILLAFSVEPEHDRATLERYLREYPDLAEDLVDLSLELRLLRTAEGESRPSDEAWVEGSWAAFQATSPPTGRSSVADPFAAVSSDELVALRRRLDVPSGVMEGFRSRLVRIATAPAWFVEEMASGLRVGVDELRDFMSGPRRLTPGLSFKADEAPSSDGEQITFEELLEQCRVPEEKRRRLLSRRD